MRQRKTKPLAEALKTWLEKTLAQVAGGSWMANAIRYAFNRWDGLLRFLDDGRIEINSNTVERAMRPIALNRKNALFAGSDEGASCCSSHHTIDKFSRFCWRSSGGGRRDRRKSAWQRTSARTRSACRIIQGAPLQCCFAGRTALAIRRRMVEVLTARTVAASSIHQRTRTSSGGRSEDERGFF